VSYDREAYARHPSDHLGRIQQSAARKGRRGGKKRGEGISVQCKGEGESFERTKKKMGGKKVGVTRTQN